MRKILILPIVFIIYLLLPLLASAEVHAAKMSFSPSGGTIESGDTIDILIDAEGEELQSATAVFSYDSSKVDISIEGGSYFDLVSTDTTTTDEIAVTGTLTMGKLTGVTGSGTLATLTITPKITNGSFDLTFSCSDARGDSNIQNMDGEYLLATNEQCSQLQNGSYTIGSGETDDGDDSSDDSNDSDPTATPTSSGSQPAVPETLPQSGPENWLKWLASGLALLGIGILLL